ncbi:MAG: hypothetical protein HZB31_04335 [Nitrospirae bacterium]|nr:hypothetical protein [Nitrospirota bacterium]
MDDKMKETLTHIIKTGGAVLLCAAGILFILYLLSIPFDIYIIYWIYDYVVEKIGDVSGLNQNLLKASVLIALIPLLWVIPNLIRGNHKKEARAAVILYFSLFFFATYYFSRDINFSRSAGKALKYYAITPEGVKFFDKAGVDPLYGIALKPVTPDSIKNLRLLQKGEFKAVDPTQANLFNPVTGDPQVWYFRHEDGRYQFFNKPGYHPVNGEALSPITKQIYADWKKKVEAEEKRQAEERRIAEEKRKIAERNFVKNGDFANRHDNWEKKIGDVSQGASTAEIISLPSSKSGRALHLKHEGNGFIQFSQVLDIESIDMTFSASFQMKSHEGMIMGFTGTGIAQIGLFYLDAEGNALGETVLLNYQKNPFADTGLIGVPKREGDSYKKHYIEINDQKFRQDFRFQLKSEIEDHLHGMDMALVKKIAILIWCGANHHQAGSELWIADIGLRKQMPQ